MTPLGPDPFPAPPAPALIAGKVQLLGAAQVSLTALVAVFDRELSTEYPGAYWDAERPENYVLTATGGAYLPAVVTAELDPDTPQVILETDAPMEPGVVYTLTVTNVRAATGESLATTAVTTFVGAAPPADKPLVLVADERYRDFLQVATAEGDGLGYAYDPSGDLTLGSGAESLRQRIWRRVFSSPGDWGWDPAYGAGIRVGTLARAGRLQEAANAAAEQIRQEPDVVDASVTAALRTEATGAFVTLDCRVRTSLAAVTYTYQVAG